MKDSKYLLLKQAVIRKLKKESSVVGMAAKGVGSVIKGGGKMLAKPFTNPMGLSAIPGSIALGMAGQTAKGAQFAQQGARRSLPGTLGSGTITF